jgi:hypothetical protein
MGTGKLTEGDEEPRKDGEILKHEVVLEFRSIQ